MPTASHISAHLSPISGESAPVESISQTAQLPDGTLFLKTREEISEFLEKELRLNRNSYDFMPDNSVKVYESVSFKYFLHGNKRLFYLPVRFNEVAGNFDCSKVGLVSLEGCPENVEGHFDCSENNLRSLKYGPKEVAHNFFCNKNQMTNLVGGPITVGGNYDCSNNKLVSLKGVPRVLEAGFYAHRNKLKTLEFVPKNIKGDCAFDYNPLSKFDFLPDSVGGSFGITHTQITSLKGFTTAMEENAYFRYTNTPIEELVNVRDRKIMASATVPQELATQRIHYTQLREILQSLEERELLNKLITLKETGRPAHKHKI